MTAGKHIAIQRGLFWQTFPSVRAASVERSRKPALVPPIRKPDTKADQALDSAATQPTGTKLELDS